MVDSDDGTCPCCKGDLHKIGEDGSERLEMVPAQFRVIVTRRPKYARRACEDGILQAEAPARLIEGGLPTEATAAQALVSNMPIICRSIGRPDLCPLGHPSRPGDTGGLGWHVAFHLRPLHERLLTVFRARSKLFADETTVPVLDPGRGHTKTGRLWAYAADDRPWGGLDPPSIAYVYAPDRKAERLFSHLAGFKGVLQGRWL
ncbi:IS66 family transposase [Bradyrhizobium macuxiense]|uniref:IS66 family transposase n=1 Tax=Bradyrhizobium macuxiense TaxID=1755647 RepID=UPI000AC683DE